LCCTACRAPIWSTVARAARTNISSALHSTVRRRQRTSMTSITTCMQCWLSRRYPCGLLCRAARGLKCRSWSWWRSGRTCWGKRGGQRRKVGRRRCWTCDGQSVNAAPCRESIHNDPVASGTQCRRYDSPQATRSAIITRHHGRAYRVPGAPIHVDPRVIT